MSIYLTVALEPMYEGIEPTLQLTEELQVTEFHSLDDD